jgi:hypothetical protein
VALVGSPTGPDTLLGSAAAFTDRWRLIARRVLYVLRRLWPTPI